MSKRKKDGPRSIFRGRHPDYRPQFREAMDVEEGRDRFLRALSGASPEQRDAFRATFARLRRVTGPCRLCGACTRNVARGFYEPPRAKRPGAARGKNRLYFYRI